VDEFQLLVGCEVFALANVLNHEFVVFDALLQVSGWLASPVFGYLMEPFVDVVEFCCHFL